MASLLFKDKGGINLSCTSPASAAVCTSLERRSMVRPSIGRAVDIYNRRPKSRSQILSNKNRENQNTSMLASPAGSSRFLLNANSFNSVSEIVSVETKDSESEISNKGEIEVLKTCSSARHDKVVVLRVSLHCKGCEGKVRKHISKMEGVTSFEIDMAKKKVTIVGNITPLRVLNSVSKVKNAQFWPSPPRASASF